jgi:hypothetical protein
VEPGTTATERVQKFYQDPEAILEYRVLRAVFGQDAAAKFLAVMRGFDETLAPLGAKMTGGR